MNNEGKKVVLLGAGGHARVLLSILRAQRRFNIVGVCDPVLSVNYSESWHGIPVLDESQLPQAYTSSEILFVNGLGHVPGKTIRADIFTRWKKLGYNFATLVHSTAYIADDVEFSEGVQVMAGVIIQPGVKIGYNSIINTATTIDHDTQIGADVHLAPGVTVCGDVVIQSNVFVGCGASIGHQVKLERRAIIASGVSVVKDVKSKCIVLPPSNRIRVFGDFDSADV